MSSLPLVIGLGTEERCDDGVGLYAVRALRERLKGSARVVECHGDATELLELWTKERMVVVIDAIRSGRTAGSVLRIDVQADPLPTWPAPTSSHALSLTEAVELGQALGQMPRRLIVYGVEAASFEPGRALTPAVAEGGREVVGRVAAELTALSEGSGGVAHA